MVAAEQTQAYNILASLVSEAGRCKKYTERELETGDLFCRCQFGVHYDRVVES